MWFMVLDSNLEVQPDLECTDVVQHVAVQYYPSRAIKSELQSHIELPRTADSGTESERDCITPFQPHKADAGAARTSPGRSRVHNQGK